MKLRKLSRKKEVSGHIPKFGAIFMSNRSTLEECFERKLLGLPYAMSSFVSRVKAGMTLFLFEFEERKLHGVFEAISDGGMNIVPQAFISTGRSFPAQVKFTTIWHCDPLLENEFRDAIRDNYFGTYKFNFGLSKKQIASLLRLFSSRKLKIPKTLHRKRKNRKQDDKSIKGWGMKRRFAEIELSERELDMHHADSDISEPDVERHFSSSDPCRNFESVYFDHEAYDPENPGFHHSVVSEALSAASQESHELLTLQSKKESFHISAEETEEYIPLCLPDHSADPEVEGFDFGKCSGEEQIELDIFVDNKLSFIPVPQLPLAPISRDEGHNQTETKHQFDSSLGSPCYRLDDSSYADVSLSNVIAFQSKDASNHFKPQQAKGMYSDKLKKRASVFSRLTFPTKDITSKCQNDMSRVKKHSHVECEKVDKITPQKNEIEDPNVDDRTSEFYNTSVFSRLNFPTKDITSKSQNGMSRVKKRSHVECEKVDKITPQKNEIEDPNVDDRASEYFPLISALYAVPQHLHCMTGLKESTGALKKGNKDKFPRIKTL